MQSKESSYRQYEQENLTQRLKELRAGDPAYDFHLKGVVQALLIISDIIDKKPNVLDVGCGLGFITNELQDLSDKNILINGKVIGVDPSKESISLAKNEHPGVGFYSESVIEFAEKMNERKIKLFDSVVLNMVMHSIDDNTLIETLSGIKKCLEPVGGSMIFTIPTQDWTQEKLMEHAISINMEESEIEPWIINQFKKEKIEIPIKIRGGKYYPQPLVIYNRSVERYEEILLDLGFGIYQDFYDENDSFIERKTLPYVIDWGYFPIGQLREKERPVLYTFLIEDRKI